MPGSPLAQRTVRAGGRTFEVAVLRFGNGSFVSVSEGGMELGPTVVSLGTGPAPVTAQVVPARHDALFLRLVAEKAAAASRGIAIVSSGVRGEIGTEAGKELMAEIVGMVRGG